MRAFSVLAAALALAACGPEHDAGEPASAPQGTSQATTEAPSVALGPGGSSVFLTPLTQDGWGEVKIGMTHDQALAALGGKAKADTATKGADWTACHMIAATEPEGLWIMVENDKVTRITLRTPAVRTDAQLKVGDPKDRVLGTYPDLLKRDPHKYQDPPAEYLTWWATPDKSGIRYAIGEEGLVQEIHAGGPSIRYVEGCS